MNIVLPDIWADYACPNEIKYQVDQFSREELFSFRKTQKLHTILFYNCFKTIFSGLFWIASDYSFKQVLTL